MKYLKIIAVVCFITACSSQENKNHSGVTDSVLLNNKTVLASPVQHEITFGEACNYLSDLLKDPNLKSKAESFTLGGFIPSGSIKFLNEPDKAVGMRFYPCYDGVKGKVFVVWTDKDTIFPRSPDLCAINFSKQYYISTGEFNWNGGGTDSADIAKYLLSFSQSESIEIPDTFPSVEIAAKCAAFQALYSYSSGTSGNTKNTSPCSAINFADLKGLIEQPDHKGKIIGIRYFFGFAPERKCNNVRLIFMAVKDSGENLIQRSNGTPGTMIQRDWPTPCN